MTRPAIVFALIAALLAGGLAGSLLTRPAPSLSESDIRAIVSAAMADSGQQSGATAVADIDPATIHPMIESYLMANPSILERMSTALQAEQRAEDMERSRTALAGLQDEIYNDPDHVVLGNPDGDVTLVEMFDYNCGYCRGAVGDMVALLDSDPDLRIILKEFPILSQESVEAARIAVAAKRAGIDYLQFHTALFTSRGKVDKQAALDAAAAQGLNPVSVELAAQGKDVDAVIERSYQIAQAVGTTGTPTYIIGDEVIPGAVGLDGLKQRIANIRACGSTQCDS